MKLIPRRKKPTQLQQQLDEFNDEVAKGRLQEAVAAVQAPLPFADQCSRVRTRTGKVAHLRHPDLGVMCMEMCDWPGPWFQAPDAMPVHARCVAAARVEDERDLAS